MKPARATLDERRRELAAAYLPLARSLARRFALRCPGLRDEFESASLMALVLAARAYDLARDGLFGAYARRWIVGRLLNVHRREYLRRAEVPLGRRDFASREPRVGAGIEAAEEAARVLARLPAKHALACRLHHLGGMSQSAAARRMGCSQAEVNRLCKQSAGLVLSGRAIA